MLNNHQPQLSKSQSQHKKEYRKGTSIQVYKIVDLV